MNRSPSKRDEAGYSLIELMVGLVIMTIMLGTTIPAMSRYLRDHELLGFVENYAADLRLCRQRATAEGNNFLFLMGAGGYTLVDDINNNGTQDSGEASIGPRAIPDGVTVTNDSVNPFLSTTIVFLPSGAANQGGQVRIADAHGLSRSVMLIRATGMVKVL